ncbi:hypothetical protein [Cryptosporangium arvum]|uniref:Uncharacterized protein n=1 Tax=Cryptosporangium arvum DSM 44712 TaxID=927661 RepID=A0A010YRY9_9ACTN|nr:hypothetical protein [Cryptosporangium arvum]EXG82980.1 hypothetical protein CryarDRAFT_4186 [Cryptosporangium arvum DSM 44712]
MSLPPPPSYAAGPLPYGSPPPAPPRAGRAASVRVARVAGVIGLVGAVVTAVGFATFCAADAISQNDDGRAYNDYGTSTFVAMAATTLILLLVTVAAPIGSLAGSGGRSGGRAVAWAFVPLVLPAYFIGVAGNMSAVVDDENSTAVRIGTAAGTGAAAVGVVAVLVAAVAWALPGARDFLIERRRTVLPGRGRTTLLVVAGLGGFAVLLYGVTIGLDLFGRAQADAAPATDAYSYGDDAAAHFVAGSAVAALLVAAELTLVAGALVVRSGRVAWVRGVTFTLAWMTLGGSVPAVGYFAVVWSIAGESDNGDPGVGAGRAAFFVGLAAALLHLVALVLLAMPSVSAWVASRAPRTPRPGPGGPLPDPGGPWSGPPGPWSGPGGPWSGPGGPAAANPATGPLGAGRPAGGPGAGSWPTGPVVSGGHHGAAGNGG